MINDGSIVYAGVRNALSGHPSVEIIGTETAADRALDLVGTLRPDVVVVTSAEEDLLPFTREVQERTDGATAVLVIGEVGNLLINAMVAGAGGGISWRATPEEVLRAILTTARGDTHVPEALGDHLTRTLRTASRGEVRLSKRELEVMRKAAEGQTNSSIARSLRLSEATVKTYWRRVFRKLDARDRTMAVTTAMEMGILRDPSDSVPPRETFHTPPVRDTTAAPRGESPSPGGVGKTSVPTTDAGTAPTDTASPVGFAVRPPAASPPSAGGVLAEKSRVAPEGE
ncbi:hypothetical protein GCM10027160_10730 [Streptomyces calidiresistens]